MDEFVEFAKTVRRLRAADLTGRSVDDLIAEIGFVPAGLRLTVPRLPPGVLVFRGRVSGHVRSVRELSYPPPKRTKLGRANPPGSPMFYATTARSGVFFEVPVAAGDHLLVSRWRTNDQLLVNHLGYSGSVFEAVGSSRGVPGWDGETDPLAAEPGSREVLTLLSEVFAQDPPDDSSCYKLSAALADIFMRPPLAGLLYPAMAMSANCDNLALKPRWVDSSLDFVGVEQVRIDAVAGMKRETTVVDYAMAAEDGETLEWRGRPPHWELNEQDEELRFTSEGGVWIARDNEGETVDPT